MPTQAKNCGQRLELLNVTSLATNPRDLSSHRHRALPLRYLKPHKHTNIGAQFNCKSYTNSHPFRQTNILTFRQPRQYFKTNFKTSQATNTITVSLSNPLPHKQYCALPLRYFARCNQGLTGIQICERNLATHMQTLAPSGKNHIDISSQPRQSVFTNNIRKY